MSIVKQSSCSATANAMTVDVEDYFQVSAFEKYIDRNSWDSREYRVEGNVDKILALFAKSGISATFFTLGWIAERSPDMVRRIVDQGHELASHGYSHVRVTQQKPEEFRQDVIRTKKLLEDIGGQEVKGYRAASYSIGESNLWALEVLESIGHKYSSSIYPIRHDLYGMPGAPRFAFYPNNGELKEIPITTVQFFNQRLPSGGGGYFRLLPYRIYKMMLRHVNSKDKQSGVFYFHPWEIDPEQPRQKEISFKTRFRHYLNLSVMESRLSRLLKDFNWDRMDRIFL